MARIDFVIQHPVAAPALVTSQGDRAQWFAEQPTR